MSDPDTLWKRVHTAFEPHQIEHIDITPQMAVNRIAAKCIGISFDPSNCAVHEEWLSIDDLRQLKTFHERFVIDGNQRVNKWRKEGGAEPRSALIIERKPTVS